MGCVFSCCERGGCCRQAPPQIILGPSGHVVRINLLFSLGCCEHGKGVTDALPTELFASGLKESVLREWLNKLEEINRIRRTKCSSVCRCLMISMCCPCLICGWCRKYSDEVYQWDNAMREWQKDFNEKVLVEIGHYAKTQSRCHATYDKNGKHRHIERWVAISTDPEDAQKLKEEPHLFEDIEAGCCGGPDENKCCMHP